MARSNAFTLIELLVLIGIIALLVPMRPGLLLTGSGLTLGLTTRLSICAMADANQVGASWKTPSRRLV